MESRKTDSSTSLPIILLTGAAGMIGSILRRQLAGRVRFRCFDLRPLPEEPDAIQGDIGDSLAFETAMEGVDAIIHLAAAHNSPGDGLNKLLTVDSKAYFTLYDGALRHHVRRVVMTSTIHVVEPMTDRLVPLTAQTPYKPDHVISAMKCFGEILGQFYANRHQLSVVIVRVGAIHPDDSAHLAAPSQHLLESFVSERDLAELFFRAATMPNIHYEIFYGVSDNRQRLYDLSRAREVLGFIPQDRIESLMAKKNS